MENNIGEYVPSEVCEPITSLSNLWSFVEAPPEWLHRTIEIVPRSSVVVQNVRNDCHIDSINFVPKLRLERNSTPKTLVCHDMMNGYREDRYLVPVKAGNKYSFYRWSQIDIFVYFSHKFITIPPLCWINLAHKNGVKILGTIITEWGNGEGICTEMLESMNSIHAVVKALADISVSFKLDGWLLNIENKIKETEKLRYFVKHLTSEMHKKRPGSLVIWYDSVISTGQLIWQNELNSLNRYFFDVCDGIFVNYTWQEKNLATTLGNAQHRVMDVFVGVDVFGRNTYGGGQFNSHKAAEKIRQYGFSMAIFAQGWTHETLPKEPADTFLERFLNRDNAFWKSLWPYLYTHPVTTLFCTSFYIGIDKEWFKLETQEQQLSKFMHPKEIVNEYSEVPTLKDECRCLRNHLISGRSSCLITQEDLPTEMEYVHHLFSCDISVRQNIILYTYTEAANENDLESGLNLIVLLQYENGTFRKLICNAAEDGTNIEDNCTSMQVFPSENPDVVNMVSYRRAVPNNWKLTCFTVNLEPCKIIEIGVQLDINTTSVYLHGFGIKQASLLNK